MSPLLTIIMPAYNMEAYIAEAIESVLAAKTRDHIELLVINDGSTDTTEALVKTYQEKYPACVHCISKPNGHYGSAVNRGLAEASGVFVKLVDSDDWVYPEALDELVQFLMAHQAIDLVLTDYVKVCEGECQTVKATTTLSPRTVFDFADVELRPCIMHAQTFRRQLLLDQNLRLDEGILFTDDEWSLFPMPGVKKLAYVDVAVYGYRLGRADQSVSLESLEKTLGDNYQVTQRVMNWYRALPEDWSDHTNRAYVIEKTAAIVCEHMRRRLLAKDVKQSKQVALELLRFMTDDLGLSPDELDRTFRFVQVGYGFGFGLLAAYKKMKVRHG